MWFTVQTSHIRVSLLCNQILLYRVLYIRIPYIISYTRRLLTLLEEKHAKDLAGYNLHISRLRGKDSPVPPDLKEPKHVSLYFPPLSLCTDNGMRVHLYDTTMITMLYIIFVYSCNTHIYLICTLSHYD